MDIVFTHSDPSLAKGLCKRLIKQLSEKGPFSIDSFGLSSLTIYSLCLGMVTHVMRTHILSM